MSEVEPPLAEGTQLAPGYEVCFHVARSRVLDVYDVWSAERDTHCVAKALRPDRRGELKPRRRLYREGRVLLAMTHPHIVRAYEMIAGPSPVLILEPLTGGSLDQVLRDEGPLGPEVVVELGIQLASAMHYVHGRGLVHGDLKPGNVMGDRGYAKVLDFSLARAPGRGHAGRGTAAYMPPEQARGGLVTGAADVWGIGAVMYSALTAQAPFPVVRGARRYPQLERAADRVRRHRELAPSSPSSSRRRRLPAPRPAVAADGLRARRPPRLARRRRALARGWRRVGARSAQRDGAAVDEVLRGADDLVDDRLRHRDVGRDDHDRVLAVAVGRRVADGRRADVDAVVPKIVPTRPITPGTSW